MFNFLKSNTSVLVLKRFDLDAVSPKSLNPDTDFVIIYWQE
jgi:hypothetical protein